VLEQMVAVLQLKGWFAGVRAGMSSAKQEKQQYLRTALLRHNS